MSQHIEIKQEIRRLADEQDAIILAHNYQPDEIQELADITGDSLGLSIAASETSKKVIVFCGVYFMAESAAILSPEKTVLLPRIDAGCPLADSITPQGLRKFKEKFPGVPVVTYVNSTAAVKAESDICCTSANALQVVQSLEDNEVILTPDRNLGQYIASQTDKTAHIWDGCCCIHDELPIEDLEICMAAHPDAVVLAHPECQPRILKLADHVQSTSGMLNYARKSSEKKFIIATEKGLLYQLRRENPDKEFILASNRLVCKSMKLTTLEDVRKSLATMKPVITVPEEIRAPAKKALERMLAVPRVD
ncbi:MAG: quinolinate synthase NadA [Deltaproteobacteria bacterium]|nr:quinolinate synthase NadA [Deltaproteobacteria bacterium]